MPGPVDIRADFDEDTRSYISYYASNEIIWRRYSRGIIICNRDFTGYRWCMSGL